MCSFGFKSENCFLCFSYKANPYWLHKIEWRIHMNPCQKNPKDNKLFPSENSITPFYFFFLKNGILLSLSLSLSLYIYIYKENKLTLTGFYASL